MPHTRWSTLRQGATGHARDLTKVRYFTMGYILALDDLLLDMDEAADMATLRDKIRQSKDEATATMDGINQTLASAAIHETSP